MEGNTKIISFKKGWGVREKEEYCTVVVLQ